MANLHRINKDLATALSLVVASSIFATVMIGVTSMAYAQTASPSSSCDNVSQPFQADRKTYALNINDKTYNILYNGFITSISLHSQNASLSIQLQGVPNDCLIIQLPREVIDTTNKDFQVFIDTHESGFKESSVSSNESRTLLIPLADNARTVTISGTYVIPEFGAITDLILVTMIGGTVALTRARIFRFRPRT